MTRLQKTSEMPEGGIPLFGEQGFVALVDHMGDDTTVVNAARVSFGKKVSEFDQKKDGRLINFLAKHNHHSPFRHGVLQFHMKAPEMIMRQCYDSNTEVLTNRGWVFWPEVNDKDELAAVSLDGEWHFEKPSDLIKKDFSGNLLHFKSNSVDLMVTPDHRMVVQKRVCRKNKRLISEPFFVDAKKASESSEYRIPTLPKRKMPRGDCWQFYYGLFYGMFLGDGSCKASAYRIDFNLKKSRKCLILDRILNTLRFNGTKVLSTRSGYSVYHFDNPDTELFSGGSEDKFINFDRIPMNQAFIRGMFRGLMKSDGTGGYGGISQRFATSSLRLSKSIQTLGNLMGFSAKIWINPKNGFHTVNIHKKRRRALPTPLSISYEGKVYCASVSTGALLVRRNGVVNQCGNCYKHIVGVEWTPQVCSTKDHAWNEISGRYVRYDEFYTPITFRPQSVDNKQGSEDGDLSRKLTGINRFPDDNDSAMSVREVYEETIEAIKVMYNGLIDAGVSKEQARLLCPFATMTEVYWTASLQAIVNFIKLRTHESAQFEIRELANAVKSLVEPIFPYSMKALEGNI